MWSISETTGNPFPFRWRIQPAIVKAANDVNMFTRHSICCIQPYTIPSESSTRETLLTLPLQRDIEEAIMCHLLLSDVQSTNLQLLHAILVGTGRDMVETCRKFNLHAAQAERLRAMNPAEVWNLVHAVGQISLFVPRADLVALIDSPPALAGTLAAARPPLSAPSMHMQVSR
jgi:hypothetical protein